MEWIRLLKETPVPTILILAGIFFLVLSVAGGIAGKINILPGRQRISLAIGIILLIVGVTIYLVPGRPPATPSTSQPTAGPTEGDHVKPVDLKPSELRLDLLNTARSWPAIEKDVFSGSESNWCQGSYTFDQGTITRRISDGKYAWDLKLNAPWAVYCAPASGNSLNDFYIAVDARLLSGPKDKVQFGLQMRVVGDPGDEYYVLKITDSQYWEFARWSKKEWREWGWVPARNIRPGEYNRLEIVTEGARFHFYINGDSAGYIDDDDGVIPLGRTGLYLENGTAGEAVVEFDNFDVRKKPE